MKITERIVLNKKQKMCWEFNKLLIIILRWELREGFEFESICGEFTKLLKILLQYKLWEVHVITKNAFGIQ